MDELLSQFLIEARDLIEQATDDLLALERQPDDRPRLDGAFRAVHTLKGSVGLFEWPALGAALHAGEDLLGALREGRAVVDRRVVDALLGLIGQTERWIADIAKAGVLPSDAGEIGTRLAGDLRSLLPGDATAAAPVGGADSEWADELLAEFLHGRDGDTGIDGPLLAIRYVPHAECFFAGDDPLALVRAVPDLVGLRVSPREPWAEGSAPDPFACNLVIEALSRGERAQVQAIFRFVPDQVVIREVRAVPGPVSEDQTVEGETHDRRLPTSTVVRVDSARIDRLVDLVGELIIAKNTLGFLADQAAGLNDMQDALVDGLAANHAAIDRLAATLHTAVMGIRMLPLRDAFRSLPRAAREVAGRLGKEVDLVIQGEAVEADKAVVEGVFEPLLHLVRNAVDHGIEEAAARAAAGKPALGRIDVRARRQGDRVLIEVADDGQGIDPARIRMRARQRNWASDDILERMSDIELVDLVFAPGFSTAGEVTDISGRGVGMDAVRVGIERLGGRVSIESMPGQGTTVRLALPATAVMTKVMVVRAGSELFGLPMEAVLETTRVQADRVVPIRAGEAFVHRDRTIPLVRLPALLALPDGTAEARELTVVLAHVSGEPVGIAVEGLGERMDILLRPLGGLLTGVPGFAGTTLLGNGKVLMVLDLQELIG